MCERYPVYLCEILWLESFLAHNGVNNLQAFALFSFLRVEIVYR